MWFVLMNITYFFKIYKLKNHVVISKLKTIRYNNKNYISTIALCSASNPDPCSPFTNCKYMHTNTHVLRYNRNALLYIII